MTERLVAAGRVLGIDVFDHIIVAEGGFTSLREEGLMRCLAVAHAAQG